MLGSFSHIAFLAISAISLTACNNAKSDNNIAEIENSDSIPVKVKQLIRAVADNDSVGFAGLVSYPLSRPYPLRDLNNKEELEKYYSKLVDDSLKSALTSSKVSDWEEYGWRGWSLKNGEYLWIDENLYDVPYVSSSEHIVMDSLVRLEIATLHPSLRNGWRPAGALRSHDKKTICRIDRQTSGETDPIYRLSVYRNGANLSEIPTDIFTGHKTTEGTAGTRIYHFADTVGSHAVFEPETPDGSVPQIEFIYGNGVVDTFAVERIYWMDLFKSERFNKK